MTVPDMTCIPIGHRLGCVPWHLLEATHVNFFNHRSLTRALEPHYRSVRLFQIGHRLIEGSFMPASLAAIATKLGIEASLRRESLSAHDVKIVVDYVSGA